jgi:hypothetical protein
MTDLSAFRRSRIYAQGWNAARDRSPRTGTTLVQKAENPYTSEAERSRWDEGYANALRSNRQVRFTPSRASTDPATR